MLTRCDFQQILPSLKLNFLNFCTRWLARMLPELPLNSANWLRGQVRQALELATRALHPCNPLGPSSARLEEPASLR